LVDALWVPDEVARVEQRGFLTVVEAVGVLELEELVVVLLGGGLLSSRERPLRPSVVAVDRL
jgi:hypothetical protein